MAWHCIDCGFIVHLFLTIFCYFLYHDARYVHFDFSACTYFYKYGKTDKNKEQKQRTKTGLSLIVFLLTNLLPPPHMKEAQRKIEDIYRVLGQLETNNQLSDKTIVTMHHEITSEEERQKGR